MSTSFNRLATATATTKRSPAISNARRGAPVAYLTDEFSCLPLDPLDTNTANSIGVDRPHEKLQTMVREDLDIIAGDVLVVDSVDYPILQVEKWEWSRTRTDYRLLILKKTVL